MKRPKELQQSLKDGDAVIFSEYANRWQAYCTHLEEENKKLKAVMQLTEAPFDYGDNRTVEFAIKIVELENKVKKLEEENAILKKGTTMSCEACNRMDRENQRYREALKDILRINAECHVVNQTISYAEATLNEGEKG